MALSILSILLTIFAAIMAVPTFTFLVEILAAVILQGGVAPVERSDYGRLAVLVPAHNESRGMIATLTDIKAQMREGDRLLVVADNCSDDTAEVAAAEGAEVAIRNDANRIGKGFALDFGIGRLAADPPAMVAVIDADCRLGPGALRLLASACSAQDRAVQGLNLMIAPEESRSDYRVAIFAFRVKNLVRASGVSALGLPCHLTGTGMLLPWEALSSINLASGSIVEDIKLSLDLTAAGHPPIFCPAARIESAFPSTTAGSASQRARWELGHLGVIGRRLPSLLVRALAQRNWRLLAAALDIAVPPLALLGLALMLLVAVSALAVLFGASATALAIAATSFFAYAVALFLCWLKFGRDVLPLRSLPSMARFIADKFPIYRGLFTGNAAKSWVRTDRKK
jgi:cellulose synthase/poly-beta-1,6-N-acetylglucosamine synthase-like glycosyltransferase